MLIDSHVNLHAPQFDPDREAAIGRAGAAGVALMIEICDRLEKAADVCALAEAHPAIWATVGVHPHEAKDAQALTPERLCELATHPKVVAIGETGLDFHYDLSPRDVQARAFRLHIQAARRTGLPLVVHSRNADEETAEILESEHAVGAFPILMHCYTSGLGLARRAAALGAWFSVSGIVTFKGAEAVRAAVREMPADRILVETDCPYLAPVPVRGRRNEPAFLPYVAAGLGRTRGWTDAETEARTESAFFRLFTRITKA